MARRRSLTRKVLYLGVLVLAVFGAWTLYTSHKVEVDNAGAKVVKKAKKVRKVIAE